MDCLPSFRTKSKVKYHEKVCKNKDFCETAWPTQKDNILKFNQYMKSDKTPCIVYADLESLIKKIGNRKNNPEQDEDIDEDIICGYSMSTIWGFENIENKHSV